MKFTFDLDSKGYIKKRESFDLEFKQNFQGGDNLLKVIKTLVGMANNKGGEIVFGIQNSPHIPTGMTNNRFHECDPKDIDSRIREYFSQELIWKSDTVQFNGVDFGVLTVEENQSKPIICKKNKDGILREAAIYYRYRGETKEIEYPQLRDILEKEKEKEKLLWMQHIQKIAMIGPKHVHLLDSFKGEINVGEGKILLDKNILDKINFIREGHFVEDHGAPAFKLLGEISGFVDSEMSVASDVLYPLFTADLQERLNLNGHEVMCIIWKLKIKGNQKYHTENKTGKRSNSVNKYSEQLIPLLERMLKRPDFLKTCKSDYSGVLKKRKESLSPSPMVGSVTKK
jgi:hypothetical protein